MPDWMKLDIVVDKVYSSEPLNSIHTTTVIHSKSLIRHNHSQCVQLSPPFCHSVSFSTSSSCSFESFSPWYFEGAEQFYPCSFLTLVRLWISFRIRLDAPAANPYFLACGVAKGFMPNPS